MSGDDLSHRFHAERGAQTGGKVKVSRSGRIASPTSHLVVTARRKRTCRSVRWRTGELIADTWHAASWNVNATARVLEELQVERQPQSNVYGTEFDPR